MKLTFYSNFFNHHQRFLSEAFYQLLGDDYTFVATTPVPTNRLKLGYQDLNKSFPYVLTTYDNARNAKQARNLAKESDVIIIGSAPKEYSDLRIGTRKLMFRYAERPLKKGFEVWKYPYRFVKWHLQNPHGVPIYMLCASAYTAGDYAKFGLFRNRTYKWGYFPEVKRCGDIDALIAKKKPASILWAGRLIGWKHPETSILVAEKLRQAGYNFELNIIGNGEMEQQLRDLIQSKGLGQQVHMLGSMPPEQVREYMEESEIFLFTSDRNEGWGAVLNESMNSGCAVVASHEIGSVPFLIRHNENGLVYESGNTNELFQKVTSMLDSKEVRARMGKMAYETMVNQWNAENAAQRLLRLAQAVLDGGNPNDLFADGVCSPAKTIK